VTDARPCPAVPRPLPGAGQRRLRGPGGARPDARRPARGCRARCGPPPCRVVQVTTGTTRQDGPPDVVLLVATRRDLDAARSAVASRYRWAVELWFRGVKGVLGCRQWLSQGSNGVRLQV
jgi:hypothetical protein